MLEWILNAKHQKPTNKEVVMLDQLVKLFAGAAFNHVALVLSHTSQIMELLGEKYVQDKSAKNALIDAVIAVLTQHKDAA